MSELQKIVNGGYCIGCGACTCATDGAIPVVMDGFGQFQVSLSLTDNLSSEELDRSVSVCPFSNRGPNEDEIGKQLFNSNAQHDSRIGYYKALYVGHVAENNFRTNGSSGGIITWILTELLKIGKIDAVAHVKRVKNQSDGVLFRYGVSRTVEEIMDGAKSRYYPIEMSEILKEIKRVPGRYAIVGLPCFLKAVRRLAEMDPVIKQRVAFCVGLVCGHLKSRAFADCFGWQVGIPPGELEEIDFRVKLPGRTAGDYGVYLRGVGKEIVRPTREFAGSNWGHNFFRYSACNYCDDVVAETADVSIGDAWLPEYEKDSKGTSIVIVRDEALCRQFDCAVENGRLVLKSSTSEQVAQSQVGGLRDRREGLAYRLYLKNIKQIWVPQKRIEPNRKHITYQRKQIYKARSAAGEASHLCWKTALEQMDLSVFLTCMCPYVKKIERSYTHICKKILSNVKGYLFRRRINNT